MLNELEISAILEVYNEIRGEIPGRRKLIREIKNRIMQKFLLVRKNGEMASELRLGDVGMHKSLLHDTSEGTAGGGMYEVDEKDKTLRLWGSSYDFGYPCFSDLKYIPEIYKDFKIIYTDQTETIDVRNKTLEEIEYV